MHMSCVKSDFLDSVASQVQSVVVVATKVIKLYSAFLKSLDLSSALHIMCDYYNYQLSDQALLQAGADTWIYVFFEWL
jgi:hypothetical protein